MSNIRWQVNSDVVEEIHKVVVHRFRMGDVEDNCCRIRNEKIIRILFKIWKYSKLSV